MAISDDILARAAPVLDRMLAHRFVEDICADRLPRDVFHRYLAYEGAFVETAISIFAYATARAPDMAARRWLIGVQSALAESQIPYFEDRFAQLGIAPDTPLPPQARAFDKRMLEIAERGSFVDIVTAMFAAEWMYLAWSRRAHAGPISDPDLRAWVGLHVDDTFVAQAEWLKSAIDTHADPADTARLAAIFVEVTELEIAFHHAPYAPCDEVSA
ncbi:TenA family transcriptional regulator [Palleronia sediminis]|uniref:Aminopyrimidine aminohydrolase n=1 Tax=Palleronia sediminis TaxID=2547833 RepID=A0A4R6A3W7_9RHOB|nr:TenA family protein [Palleronia sediminis]TDL78280.1 TenA family transcriptional regulator [Palleronia sediminis]